MTARCQRNSCSWASVIKPSSSFLWGWRSSRCFRVTFSVASAARIRTSGSADHKPEISSGKSSGSLETIAATWSERPIVRRSPPSRRARMSFRSIERSQEHYDTRPPRVVPISPFQERSTAARLSLALARVQLVECALQLFKLLSGLAEPAFRRQALIVGKVFGGFRDQSIDIRCGLRRRRR